MSRAVADRLYRQLVDVLRSGEQDPDPSKVLALVETFGISGYDAQFVGNVASLGMDCPMTMWAGRPRPALRKSCLAFPAQGEDALPTETSAVSQQSSSPTLRQYQFVALAQELDAPLMTQDREVLKKFPAVAQRFFVKGS